MDDELAKAPPLPSEANDVSELAENTLSCESCGAELHFQPGTDRLGCPYCGHENVIEMNGEVVEELDYQQVLVELAEGEDLVDVEVVRCDGCGAQVDRPAHLDAFSCPFCGDQISVVGESRRVVKPKSLLPFFVKRQAARGAFELWIKGLWFAPNKLKAYARADDAFRGVYLPHWTYDTRTVTDYRGQRGEDYWTTETYTTRVNGKSVTRTRQVRRTRWYPASGTVYVPFDNVLVVASESLPGKYVQRLEPWGLEELVPYQDEYVSGFMAERYQVDLPEGFHRAKEIMQPSIRQAIRSDIGGDHQRISWTRSQYNNITFKHILLPVWMNAYRYGGKVYRVMVNARTGEVQGERPWSWAKILLAVTVGLCLVGLGLLLFGTWSS